MLLIYLFAIVDEGKKSACLTKWISRKYSHLQDSQLYKLDDIYYFAFLKV